MPCVLNTGVTLDCRTSLGGVKSVYIGSTTGQAITISGEANGVITGVTAQGGTISITTVADLTTSGMFEFQQPRQSASLSETGAFSEENGTAFYTSVLSFVVNTLEGEKLDTLNILGQNTRLVVIVLDQNDRYWILGNASGAIVTASTSETGTAFGDRSGITIEVTGLSPQPMYELNIS
jgi:hypothetical protein